MKIILEPKDTLYLPIAELFSKQGDLRQSKSDIPEYLVITNGPKAGFFAHEREYGEDAHKYNQLLTLSKETDNIITIKDASEKTYNGLAFLVVKNQGLDVLAGALLCDSIPQKAEAIIPVDFPLEDLLKKFNDAINFKIG